MAKEILVVGSSNIDLILRVPRFHSPGETIRGDDLVTAFGGKGANQAIAAIRLGGNAEFITKLGNDHYGKTYRTYLVEAGVNRNCILRDEKRPTGVAVIELNRKGENRIIVSPGANNTLTDRDLRALRHRWKGIRVFVTQLEIPLPAVRRGLMMAKAHGAITLLNPSPVTSLPEDLFSLIDFLVPNEWEAERMTGVKMRGDRDLPRMALPFLRKGVNNVVITLGSRGVFFKNKEGELRVSAYRVKPVDSTAAGDAFMGGLACGLSARKPIEEGLKFAAAAGALATTKLGAQASLPFRKNVEKLAGL